MDSIVYVVTYLAYESERLVDKVFLNEDNANKYCERKNNNAILSSQAPHNYMYNEYCIEDY